jgi:Tfp pilus assembly protein PilO
MSPFLIFALLVLLGLLGGNLYDMQKIKSALNKKNSADAEETEQLKAQLKKMQKRIENLEAIAAESPDSFREQDNPLDMIEVSFEDEIRTENEQKVSEMAKNKESEL